MLRLVQRRTLNAKIVANTFARIVQLVLWMVVNVAFSMFSEMSCLLPKLALIKTESFKTQKIERKLE